MNDFHGGTERFGVGRVLEAEEQVTLSFVTVVEDLDSCVRTELFLQFPWDGKGCNDVRVALDFF